MNEEKSKEKNEQSESKPSILLFFIKIIFIRLWYFIKGKSFKEINSSATFWDVIAAGMDKPLEKKDPHIDPAIEKVKTYLKNSDRVLDYGCATGSDAFAIAGLVRHVDGIDISPKMISIANRRAAEINCGNVRFFTLDQHKDENQGNYDVIFSLYVLHLIDDIKPVLNNLNNLLTPEGIFISSTVCLGEKRSFMFFLLSFFRKTGLIPELTLYQTNDLLRLIESEQFEILENGDLKNEKNYKNLFIIAKKAKL